MAAWSPQTKDARMYAAGMGIEITPANATYDPTQLFLGNTLGGCSLVGDGYTSFPNAYKYAEAMPANNTSWTGTSPLARSTRTTTMKLRRSK